MCYRSDQGKLMKMTSKTECRTRRQDKKNLFIKVLFGVGSLTLWIDSKDFTRILCHLVLVRPAGLDVAVVLCSVGALHVTLHALRLVHGVWHVSVRYHTLYIGGGGIAQQRWGCHKHTHDMRILYPVTKTSPLVRSLVFVEDLSLFLFGFPWCLVLLLISGCCSLFTCT